VTYPNYPQQPQPTYPPQQPAYSPQQSPYPPQQPAYYPPPQTQFQAPPAPELTIDDFFDQPAASGKSISAWFQTPGQSISGIVARPVSKADMRAQTDMQTKQPKYFSDGRPMVTMTVPLLVQPQPDFPDGRAAWIVGAGDRDDLLAAMRAAGCPETVKLPEAGAVITVTYVGPKQIPGFGAPKKVKRVSYQRPSGGNGQAVPPTEAAAPIPGAPAPAPQYAPPEQPPFQQPQYGNPYPQTMPGAFGQSVPVGQIPDPNLAYQQATSQPMPPPFQPPFQQPQYTDALGFPQNGPGVSGALGAPQYQQPQYQQAPPTPAPPAAPVASPSGPVPPAAAPSPSNGYAVPAELTPEQAERLRQLTGQ
jgi:hypothetical protein